MIFDGKPRVQLSLDLQTLADALPTAEVGVRAGVDWLEAGTPLILGEGLHAVEALHERFPNHPIIADLKTMDAGYLEAEMMFKAGATFVVVMGVAHERTVREAIRAAQSRFLAAGFILRFFRRCCRTYFSNLQYQVNHKNVVIRPNYTLL